MKTIKYFPIIFLLLSMVNLSCKKDWLDKKRDVSLIVPTTLKDFRLLLNSNFPEGLECRGLGILASGEYTISDNNYKSLSSYFEKEGYLWKDDLFKGTNFVYEWDMSYTSVLNANVILEGLQKITPDPSNQTEYNDIKGGALYRRATAFFNVAQLFARPYDPQTAEADLGIPLRTVTDINVKSTRATVKQTYDLITADLLTASTLLAVIPANKTNASRPAAYGLLARCYLSMRVYDKAQKYADLALKDYSKLMDYNALDPAVSPPFQLFNDEVVYMSNIYSIFTSFRSPVNNIDPGFLSQYDSNDLRKKLFFITNADGSFSFQGTYSGDDSLFGGIATDELLLMRAECAARAGDFIAAATDLNSLLVTRYKKGSYSPLTFSDAQTALTTVLTERRKELVMRGLRWIDLRRLNKEPQFAVTQSRTISGVNYTLPPNDPRYTFLIPDYVITASGIQQNPR